MEDHRCAARLRQGQARPAGGLDWIKLVRAGRFLYQSIYYEEPHERGEILDGVLLDEERLVDQRAQILHGQDTVNGLLAAHLAPIRSDAMGGHVFPT